MSYVLSDAYFDLLGGSISAYQENLFRTRSKKNIFFVCRITFETYFIKALDDSFFVLTKPHLNTLGVGGILDSYTNFDCVRVCITVLNSQTTPLVFRRGQT